MCVQGVPNASHKKCEPCPANHYLDDQAAAGGKCEKCPADMYSTSNSIGSSACIKREPCKESDYTALYSDCDPETNMRQKAYTWIEPVICNTKSGVSLPPTKDVPCRGCTRGQHRDAETDHCVFCDAGEFQDHDNHDGKGKKIKQCEMCEPGHYAPKEMELSYFERMPTDFVGICSETNDVGRPENCDLMRGWHVNLD